jgi:hypothetical protein
MSFAEEEIQPEQIWNDEKKEGIKKLIQEYTDTLNPFELQGLAIAKDHLGPSFDMKRSSGFIRWMDAKKSA